MSSGPEYWLDARFTQGAEIACTLHSSRPEPLPAPVICLSLLDAFSPVSGGRLCEALGGFGALALEGTLSVATPLRFTIAYDNVDDTRVVNRAWLPAGVYLRLADGGTRPVATTHARGVRGGVRGQRRQNPAGQLRLIPPPRQWQPAPGLCDTGRGFAMAPGAPFASAFAAIEALARRRGLPAFAAPDGLRLEVRRDKSLGPEAYELKIGEAAVRLAAASRKGAFYGAVSLQFLRLTHGERLPCGTIRDAPRFGWRSQHLDCARHFFRPETIEHLLDLMALLKMNVFHWHFADDEAFRLEVESHPELWRKTAFRGEGRLIAGVFGGGAGPTGGSYGLDFARALVARGRQLEIDILPEIEFPAHCLAVVRAMPGLRDPLDRGKARSVQGYFANTLNPALPEVWDFIAGLASEIAGIFPMGVLHVGGDEVAPGAWDASPAIAALGPKGAPPRPTQDVQGEAMARLGGLLGALGIRAAAWEEATLGAAGGIGNNALIFSWSGQGPGLAAARNGMEVIMCPGQHCYLDMAHSAAADDWGASWAGTIGLADTVNWDPVPDGAPELEARIKGVGGAFWSEFTVEDSEMHRMLAPRILGIASKGWAPRRHFTAAQFTGLAGACLPVFSALGWACNPAALAPAGTGFCG